MDRKNHFDPDSTEAIALIDELDRLRLLLYDTRFDFFLSRERKRDTELVLKERFESIRYVVELITGAPYEEFERQVRRNTP